MFYDFGTSYLSVYKGDEKDKTLGQENANQAWCKDNFVVISSASEDTQPATYLVDDFFGMM